MFTMKIVDSDAFLDIPISAQCLYFHLNMRADDDGFLNNPKKIQRMIGASEDDLKLLLAKRFVLGFEKGVIVIKHWRMHNLLRKDRYNPTQYIEEKDSLDIKEDGSYTEKAPIEALATTWQPSGNQMATQDRIGEDRIGQDSIGEDRGIGEDSEAEAESTALPQKILDLYNSICPDRNKPTVLPRADMLNDKRKQKIEESLKLYGIGDFERCFNMARRSSFLKGNNKRKWCASFDWLIDSANMAKVLAGNYTDNGATSFDVDDFYNAALAKSYAEMPKTAADDPAIQERAEKLKEMLG